MSPARIVLVVDDDPEILGALRTLLEQARYQVLTAEDGDRGLAAAERYAPDLVVVDMMMPRKSGFLVLERLKARRRAPKVIMITGNEGTRHQAYAERLGVDDYHRKPIDLEKFLGSVQRLCPPDVPPPAAREAADDTASTQR